MKKTKTPKQISGFDNDIIYIVKGSTYEYKEKLSSLGARYRKDFGWYFGSFAEKPKLEDLPTELSLTHVFWTEVGNEDGSFKNDDIIKAVVESKIYDEDPSQFVREIGERLELKVIVESKREFDNEYGLKNCYTFVDANKNCYVWFTSASTKTQFEENEEVTIRGTIKAHDTYKNRKQNLLSRVTRR